ncbi:fibrous sheath CABYR-binding protein-like [Salvia splendens]|uniref:fibrous sheath CABYR-binding protein-like n=1 Tax=Salvia splendens TaxID=180675 RepID=UPI001C26C905|nr:fibrous sheath CABYR-binding protein-like [Salvia splendens]
MGKKKWAKKQTGEKAPSTYREETPESHPPLGERPPNPQQQEPIPQAPAMVSLNALAEFLRQQDPNRDWATALAGFSQVGGKSSTTGEAPAVTAAEPIVQPTVQPPTSILISSAIPPERESPSATTPPEPSEPSKTPQQSDSMDIDPISAYYDSDPGKREARRREEQKSQNRGDEPERMPVAESTPQEMARGEIDLNETARKQGLMTDEEFEALLNEVTRMEDATMAEDPDLASRAVGEGGEASTRNDPEGPAHQPEEEVEERQTEGRVPQSVTPQPDAGESDAHIDQEETVARTEVPEPVAPPVTKPKAVKRKLVLRDDPKAVRPKPKRVSQRCLGK